MDKKSEENILAAEELISKGYYNSSIHCSYYALFQYMKYILDYCGLCNYAAQNKKTGAKNKKTGAKGSHDIIWGELNPHINDIVLRFTVDTSFQNLKKQRSVADYKISPVGKVESQKCLNEARDIIEQLKKYFNT